MHGKDEQQLDVFSYVSPKQRVPQDHPLRSLRAMTDEALRDLQPRFNKLYAKTGRPSIAPEKLLRALLLQALYSVRSERMLMEQLDYNLLFRWFVGLNMDDAVWDVTVFTKNRERLLDGNIAEAFFQAVLQQARERSLLSDEHFTVDGTLLEAWASVKSYQREDAKNSVPPDDPGNATVDFHGEKRSNQTHASKTDPDAKMARKGKGKEAKLSYNGNLLVENRNGLIVNTEVFEANGTAERDVALVMLEQIPGAKQVTVGGDKAYDTADFVAECRNLKVTPHVAQNLERPGGSAIDARTTQHVGYAISQRGSALKSASDGSRPSRCCGKSGTAASSGWDGSSPLHLPPTTWSACEIWRFKRRKPRLSGVRRDRTRISGHQWMPPNLFFSHKIALPRENLSRAVHFSAAC